MPKSKDTGSRRPTPFPDLNGLLDQLVQGAREALGDNFVGTYLHGSFALGDFDTHSDVDFTIVIREDLSGEALAKLQALHGTLHGLPNPWATRLEGSYAPAATIRRRSPEPRDPPGEPRGDDWTDPETSDLPPEVYPFWFIGNGRDRLVRSEHDNREIPRWILRERGVVLAGPHPSGLIDPVTPEALRAEMRALIDILAKAAVEGDLLKTHLYQCFTALAVARALHSLETGRVNSKKAAVAFAKHRLEPRFAALVERGWAERDERPEADADAGPYLARPADPAEAATTLELLRHAQVEAARLGEARALIERRLATQRQGAGPHGWQDADRGGRMGPPGRGGWAPRPTRPGGRGRRG